MRKVIIIDYVSARCIFVIIPPCVIQTPIKRIRTLPVHISIFENRLIGVLRSTRVVSPEPCRFFHEIPENFTVIIIRQHIATVSTHKLTIVLVVFSIVLRCFAVTRVRNVLQLACAERILMHIEFNDVRLGSFFCWQTIFRKLKLQPFIAFTCNVLDNPTRNL